MSFAFRATPEAIEALKIKPPHGSACNRCGLCCMAVPCPLACAVFRRVQGPCPALERAHDGDGYACGLIVHPERHATPERLAASGVTELREAAALLIGVGDGCDARFNGEARDEAYADALDRACDKREPRSRAAQAVWGVKNLRWGRYD